MFGKKKDQDTGMSDQKRGNRQIIVITYLCALAFLGMIAYLARFMAVDSATVINNPYNKRQGLLAQKVVRGDILSADKKVLATTTVDDDGNETRTYPYGKVFCHVVGRTSKSMTGIEKQMCFPLLTSHANPLQQMVYGMQGKKNPGDSVVTTLDSSLQQAAYDALGNQKGAVIAMDPKTGKILAMVSKPDYDPNTVEQQWSSLIRDDEENAVLLNRSTQGLYPPGSTFKLVTAIEYMKEHGNYRNYRYNCTGSITQDGYTLKCYDGEVHGTVDVKSSLAHSCNASFANMGLQISPASLRRTCEKLGFNGKLSIDFPAGKSAFALTDKSSGSEIMATAIGQGKTTITPLQNLLISASIANDGEMMRPYLIDHLEGPSGNTVRSYDSKSLGQVVDIGTAKALRKMMKAVTKEGTASSLGSLPYSVAGKTGSAEIDREGTSHAWFVGFAPANNPRIAVSIVVEKAGTGSQYAVPIARKLFENYLGSE